MTRRFLLLYILTALLSASCELATAGLGTVSGVVYSADDSTPLADVSVIYGDSAVVTDANGRYVFEGVPDGTQAMTFKKEGYGTVYVFVSVPDKGEATCDAEMVMFRNGWAVGNRDSDYGVILYSADAGATWVRQGTPASIPNVKLNDVCVIDDKTCWVVGEYDKDRKANTIIYTKDAGVTWTKQGTTISGVTNGLKGIISKDGINAWALADTIPVIIGATKSGSSWKVSYKSTFMKYFTSITTTDSKHLWACGQALDGTPLVEYSADGGKNWAQYTVDGFSGVPSSIYAVDTLNLYMAGDYTMGILRSSDGGKTWQSAGYNNQLDVVSMEAVSDEEVWACGESGNVFHSYDGFATGNLLQPMSDYVEGAALSISFLRNGQFGAAVLSSFSGATGAIAYTADGGGTWHAGNIPFNFALSAVDFVGGNN